MTIFPVALPLQRLLGTALMLLGGNSRTVAAAAEAKIEEIKRSLPPSIRAKTVLTLLVSCAPDPSARSVTVKGPRDLHKVEGH
jgi:hypothetical protein